MSDYVVQAIWSTKDALPANETLKAVSATELQTEFDAIVAMSAQKFDNDVSGAGGIATQSSAETGTDNDQVMTPLRTEEWSAVWAAENAGIVGDLQALATAAFGGADGILFYDHGTTSTKPLTLSTGLTFSGDVLTLDAQLQDISALAVTADNFLMADGANWTLVAPAAARTGLGLVIGTDVQAWDTHLDSIAALAKTDSSLMVGNGTTWVLETGTVLRTSIGVGTGDSPQFTGIELGHANDTTLEREAAGHMSIQGQTVAAHGVGQTNANYSSADIFMSTSAPTTEGADGDIWYQYTA